MSRIRGGISTLSSQYDILVIGSDKVGKTSLIHRYMYGTFQEQDHIQVEELYVKVVDSQPLGAKSTSSSVASSSSSVFKEISILDTGSFADTYATSRKQQVRNTLTMLFVYAVDDRDSFEALEYLINTIHSFTTLPPFVVAALKLDKFEDAQVMFEEGQELAERFGALDFQEASAHDDYHVKEVFAPLVERALELQSAKKANAAKSELTSLMEMLSHESHESLPDLPVEYESKTFTFRRPSVIPQPVRLATNSPQTSKTSAALEDDDSPDIEGTPSVQNELEKEESRVRSTSAASSASSASSASFKATAKSRSYNKKTSKENHGCCVIV